MSATLRHVGNAVNLVIAGALRESEEEGKPQEVYMAVVRTVGDWAEGLTKGELLEVAQCLDEGLKFDEGSASEDNLDRMLDYMQNEAIEDGKANREVVLELLAKFNLLP